MEVTSRICIKNLSKTTTEKHLKDTFAKKGEVTDVRIMKTPCGKSRLFGFIGFRTAHQATDAISYFNNTFIDSSRIIVELAAKFGDSTHHVLSRSKHTKAKLAKLSQSQDNDEKEIQPSASASSKNVAPENKKEKDKMDFFEVMKNRKSSHFWANDESLGIINHTMESKLPLAEKEVVEHGNNGSSYDESNYKDFQLKNSDVNQNPRTSLALEPVSDLEYLKSKIRKNISESDSDSFSESESIIDSNRNANKHSSKKSQSKVNQPETTKIKFTDINDSVKEDLSFYKNRGSESFLEDDEDLDDSGRLFIRNLPFTCSEDEIKNYFEVFGQLTSVHLPLDTEKKCKGFGFVQFLIPEHALRALREADGASFQGRLLHIVRAKKPKDDSNSKLR